MRTPPLRLPAIGATVAIRFQHLWGFIWRPAQCWQSPVLVTRCHQQVGFVQARGPCTVRSKVWGPGRVAVHWGPMFGLGRGGWGAGPVWSLYREVQCIMRNDHMGPLWTDRHTQTHTTENVTFPQLRWWVVINSHISVSLQIELKPTLRYSTQCYVNNTCIPVYIVTYPGDDLCECVEVLPSGFFVWRQGCDVAVRSTVSLQNTKETSNRVNLFWLKTVTSLLVETSRKLIAHKMSLPFLWCVHTGCLRDRERDQDLNQEEWVVWL